MLRSLRREPDFYIGGRENPYLLRWYIIPRNRFFNVYLHKFVRDDDDRALHDHPWASVSVILKGRYIEHMPDRTELRRAGQFIARRAVQAHRVELHAGPDGTKRPAWTLFLTGPRVREWGFHCPQGWRHWREFVQETDHGNIGKGCG